MKVTGVITEYNPFHNGHKYHIEKTKEVTGADYVIAVMSGDFVQRGTPACVQKHTRARMALLSGVDLVLELPLPYATGTAELFAKGAVSILDKLGIVDSICFGSECGDTKQLMEIVQILADEPKWYRDKLQMNLKQGLSFPAARAASLPEYADILNSPNNILGIEYCKALLRLHSPIVPFSIERIGSTYHEKELISSDSLPSATALRKQLVQTVSADISHYIPEAALVPFQEELHTNGLMHEDDFSQILLFRLLQAKSPQDYLPYEDMSEELASRIFRCKTQFISFSQFADLLKTKEITRTRINRALLHLILNVKKEQADACYARILGFRKSAQELLSEVKKNTAIPFFSKLGAADLLLDTEQRDLLNQTTDASLLYESVLAQKNSRPLVHELSKKVIVL